MATEVIARIGKTTNSLSAYVEGLDGFIFSAGTLDELHSEVEDGIKYYIESLREEGYPIPAPFKGDYEVVYKWDVEGLMNYYQGIFTWSALQRLTGINQNQLGHYAAGRSKPRPIQARKIEQALRRLGQELQEISF